MDEEAEEQPWPVPLGADLQQIETHLRCQICGEFFHGPVLLPCSHTFCSECVRRFLQSKGAHGCCPSCKQACVPRDLVSNRELERIALLFRQAKPALLQTLAQAQKHAATPTPQPSRRTTRQPIAQGDGDKTARAHPTHMALLSYNVMKDKDVRKLLEAIGIRANIKNREEIIQIHKEYVLLSNAQADSCAPKSAAQLREEVLRNHRARQQDKQRQLVESKKQKAAGAMTEPTEQMKSNFERLKQEIAARKQQQKEQEAKAIASEDQSGDDEPASEPPMEGGRNGGTWRHVQSLDTGRAFFIHSITHEIRLDAPAEWQAEQSQARSSSAVDAGAAAPSTEAAEDEDLDGVKHERKTTDFVASSPPSARKKRPLSISSSPAAMSAMQRAFDQADMSDRDADADDDDDDEDDGVGAVVVDMCRDDELPKWDCPRCTLVNDITHTECEACGYQERPARKKQKQQLQSKLSSLLR